MNRFFVNNLSQFARFALIGGIGVLVNQGILILSNIFMRDIFWQHQENPVMGVPFTDYHIRNYHIYVMLGFLVANLCNFVLNRHWTFRSGKRAPFIYEYLPFLTVGLIAQAIGMVLLTALMHPYSPIVLPSDIFDEGEGLRNKLYWANLIVIACVTPINFVINKLWTFRHVRRRHMERAGE